MSTGLLSKLTHGALGRDDAAESEEERGTRAQRWIDGSIAAWERDDRITPAQAATLHQQLEEPSVLAVLPHFGVHLAIGAVLRFPFGSITRATYTLLNLLLATARLLVRNIDRHQWRQALGIHSPLVILIAGMPGIGTFAYLAAKPVRSHHLLLRVGLDAVLLKLPFHAYERTGLRWVIARPRDAETEAVAARHAPLRVTVWAQDIVLMLGCIVGALAAADLATLLMVELGFVDPTALGWDSVVRMLDLNEESSIGTWYSAIALIALSALLGGIAFAKRQAGDRFTRHWFILSLLTVGFSIDEVAKLHDPGGAGWHDIRDRIGFSGPLLYTWVIVGALSVVVFAYFYRRFLAHLPGATRRLYILAAALFVGGEVVLEMFSGWYFDAAGTQNFIYDLITTFEESFAIAGIFIAIAATLHYIQSNFGGFRIALFESREAERRPAQPVPPAIAPKAAALPVAAPVYESQGGA